MTPRTHWPTAEGDIYPSNRFRMAVEHLENYIRQLIEPPFTPEQTAQLKAGHLPNGQL
jgi:hypothetical protein